MKKQSRLVLVLSAAMVSSVSLFGVISSSHAAQTEPTAATPAPAATPSQAEAWKGTPPTLRGDFGVLGGLGWTGNDGRFLILGSAAWKILDQGFVPEINNQVYLETELGVGFGGSSTRFIYSVHGRWDFIKNEIWTPFAIGGLSGGVDGSFTLSPRFGVGAFWNITPDLTLRGEISSDITVAGVSFAF
jgi:hypothetical protein